MQQKTDDYPPPTQYDKARWRGSKGQRRAGQRGAGKRGRGEEGERKARGEGSWKGEERRRRKGGARRKRGAERTAKRKEEVGHGGRREDGPGLV